MSKTCAIHKTPKWEVIEYQDEELLRTAFKCPKCAVEPELSEAQSLVVELKAQIASLRSGNAANG